MNPYITELSFARSLNMAISNILLEFNFLSRVWISCHLFIYDWSIICWCIGGRRMFMSLPVWMFDITGTWLYEDSTPAMTKNSNQDSKEEEHKRADDSSKNCWEHITWNWLLPWMVYTSSLITDSIRIRCGYQLEQYRKLQEQHTYSEMVYLMIDLHTSD